MRIVVLVKQVPEVAEVEIDPQRGTLKREGVQSQINPFDLHALEAGICLRDRFSGRLTVLSMGPPQAKAVLSEALSMGADDGVLLSDSAFAGADTLATAFTLSQAIRELGFDLVITGLQSTDGDTGQVGPGVAEFLGIPHVSYVKWIAEATREDITVASDLGELQASICLGYPCLISVTREANQPRLPSYRCWKETCGRAIRVWGLKDLPQVIPPAESYHGLEGSPTRVERVFSPRRNVVRVAWEGTPREIAASFRRLLRR